MYTLRPYQKQAHDAVIDWVKRCLDPCLIEAATGSGKSLIVAALAATIHQMSGKKILCIAPSAELTEQNFEKYTATGEKASIFSASLGRKDMRHNVVFGTPQTVANQVRKFGKQFAAVVVDEAHGVTPTLMKIIDHMRSQNPKLRVVGMSATPYRLGSGYIYANHYQHGAMDEAIDPFFHTLVYAIGGRELIDAGYLTPPVFEPTAEHYDTSGLEKTRTGQWSPSSLDEAFVGRGRKTSVIVADVVAQSRDRKGVMVFAATIQHAEEIMESLPPGLSRLVTGNTDKKERRQIFADFKARRIKYLVNVAVLTTGFDAGPRFTGSGGDDTFIGSVSGSGSVSMAASIMSPLPFPFPSPSSSGQPARPTSEIAASDTSSVFNRLIIVSSVWSNWCQLRWRVGIDGRTPAPVSTRGRTTRYSLGTRRVDVRSERCRLAPRPDAPHTSIPKLWNE